MFSGTISAFHPIPLAGCLDSRYKCKIFSPPCLYFMPSLFTTVIGFSASLFLLSTDFPPPFSHLSRFYSFSF
jgi:hypothetical protein